MYDLYLRFQYACHFNSLGAQNNLLNVQSSEPTPNTCCVNNYDLHKNFHVDDFVWVCVEWPIAKEQKAGIYIFV